LQRKIDSHDREASIEQNPRCRSGAAAKIEYR